jgi:hypothetical protein
MSNPHFNPLSDEDHAILASYFPLLTVLQLYLASNVK